MCFRISVRRYAGSKKGDGVATLYTTNPIQHVFCLLANNHGPEAVAHVAKKSFEAQAKILCGSRIVWLFALKGQAKDIFGLMKALPPKIQRRILNVPLAEDSLLEAGLQSEIGEMKAGWRQALRLEAKGPAIQKEILPAPCFPQTCSYWTTTAGQTLAFC
jgi:hypothetical protein